MGGLRLDSREASLKGGTRGAAIVPGNPAESLLLKAVLHTSGALKMPPGPKMKDPDTALLAQWIQMGAPWGSDASTAIAVKHAKYWAFVPPVDSKLPAVKNRDWVRNPIDAYVLQALDAKGLSPAKPADRRTLLRRATYDLTGLPPTPAEIQAFLNDTSTDAYAKVIDRLLASPRYGERWGRHWLDVARYADSNGLDENLVYKNAFRYRDYVIAAFNKDKPYDAFIKEQLAGDLMRSDDPNVQAERLIATGFLAIGPKTLNERNGTQFELDVADEQIEVTTQAFLGITAACARCHDHKFDPIPQKDYYALAGIFRSTETCYGTVRFINANRQAPLLNLPAGSVPSVNEKLIEAERKRIEGQIQTFQDSMKDLKADQQIQRLFATGQISLLQSKLAGYDKDGNPKLEAMGVRDKPTGGGRPFPGPKGPGFAGFTNTGTRSIADSPLYVRGEVDKPGEVVPRGFLQVMSASTKIRSESGRLELANWIASRNNPLTARVEANRVWQHLFGRGIVPTPENFGAAGQPPSNPALLDYLALTFVEDGWSVKKLIRKMVLSHTYQLDSKTDAKSFAADPENDLHWRMTPRRLDAEALRDSTLAVSGLLDPKPPIGSYVAKQGEGPTSGPRQGGPVQSAINRPLSLESEVHFRSPCR